MDQPNADRQPPLPIPSIATHSQTQSCTFNSMTNGTPPCIYIYLIPCHECNTIAKCLKFCPKHYFPFDVLCYTCITLLLVLVISAPHDNMFVHPSVLPLFSHLFVQSLKTNAAYYKHSLLTLLDCDQNTNC